MAQNFCVAEYWPLKEICPANVTHKPDNIQNTKPIVIEEEPLAFRLFTLGYIFIALGYVLIGPLKLRQYISYRSVAINNEIEDVEMFAVEGRDSTAPDEPQPPPWKEYRSVSVPVGIPW